MTTTASRNAALFAATAVTATLIMLYPTSTDSGSQQRRPGEALAPVGIVSSPATPAAAGATVVNGSSYGTRYGPVQVQITVVAGHITRAVAIDYPQGSGRDQEINSFAIPQLNSEVVPAQSSHIDAVSGATYTSAGYVGSLQAAIDAAHLP